MVKLGTSSLLPKPSLNFSIWRWDGFSNALVVKKISMSCKFLESVGDKCNFEKWLKCFNTDESFRDVKVTVDLQRPNFSNFVVFAPDIAKTSI